MSTPVWIAALPDGRVGFSTDANVGKVKRLRNNPAITLRPCSVRGKIADGAPDVSGRGVIVTGAEYDQVWRAVRRKYFVIANVMHFGNKLRSLVSKSRDTPTAILITLD